MTDHQLLDLALRFEDAGRHVMGFHYPPYHVIRDLRKPPQEQVIWREWDTEREAFEDQLKVERMRYAMELMS